MRSQAPAFYMALLGDPSWLCEGASPVLLMAQAELSLVASKIQDEPRAGLFPFYSLSSVVVSKVFLGSASRFMDLNCVIMPSPSILPRDLRPEAEVCLREPAWSRSLSRPYAFRKCAGWSLKRAVRPPRQPLGLRTRFQAQYPLRLAKQWSPRR